MNLYGFRFYPAAYQAVLQTALAAVVAFGFLTRTQANYITATAVALLGLITVLLSRPWVVPAIGTAMTTFLVSLAGFGLHWSDAQIAGVVGLATMIATWFVHSNVVPKAGSPSVADPQLAPLAHTAAGGGAVPKAVA